MSALTTLNLSGAYGHDYRAPTMAVKDWNEGKDFRIVSGPYCSIRDLPKIKADGYTHIAFYSLSGIRLWIIEVD